MALSGRAIVCFAGGWDAGWSTAAQVMKILARENRVLWVECGPAGVVRQLQGLREPQPNLHVLTAPSLPFRGNGLVQAANAALLRLFVGKAMSRLGFEAPISWSFSPASAPTAGTLGESLVIHHCVDSDVAAAPDRRLALEADLVFCASERLRAASARFNSNVHLALPGADLAHFDGARDPATAAPAELRGLPGPIIGRWGPIGDFIDLQLVRYVADAFSGGTVVLLGDCATSTKPLDGARNVRVLGRRPYAELPRFAKAFDVALLPFKVNERTLASNPVEARELLAAGLPVVATPLPEIRAPRPLPHREGRRRRGARDCGRHRRGPRTGRGARGAGARPGVGRARRGDGGDRRRRARRQRAARGLTALLLRAAAAGR